MRKGEKSSIIVFFKNLIKEQETEEGQTEDVKIPMMRLYRVFNANQVDGYDYEELPKPNETDMVEPHEKVDLFCANTKADIMHGKSQAYYNKVEDYIGMPDTKEFVETTTASATENYYSTLFHELCHWTGSPKRLDREFATSSGDKNQNAFEELVAELGSAFLSAQLQVSQTTREDHAQYIKSWLAALKNDNRYSFRASAQAAKAVEYLNELQ